MTDAQVADADGGARIAGKAGMGEGDRPYREWFAGELGAFDPLKEDLRDEGLSMMGGGNIVVDGVLGTEAVGVGVNNALLPC